ncbi:MAG TPA: DedA family protein [Baekduia sp.]|jgi:membrane protein DedA with SNARE-associated domain|nr:DedA family protein [Baekduia sp.]
MAQRAEGSTLLAHPVRLALVVIAGLLALLVLLSVVDRGDGLGLVVGSHGDASYLAVFGLVAADAVVPIFPGETTVNAAATLAAQGEMKLGLVILAAALGAIIGDSALFWIARRGASHLKPQVDRAKSNDKVAQALTFLNRGAPMLLLTGRYVPGLRFVVNSTMGMSDMPYRTFLPWSALGGLIWAAYTSLLAYWVGSALDDYPLASVVIAGAITTVIIGVVFLYLRRDLAVDEPAA